jgi:YidC/Oxa1 family membrane protein insertase
MLQLQPKLLELQEKYTGQELMQRQMALYKKYGVNPMGGCLYALLPIPFLILVYNAFLVYQVQFRAGHFLWVNPDMAARFPGMVGAHLGQFDAPLVLIYALSMYITSRLTITDPSQAQMQKTMAVFTNADADGLLVAVSFPCSVYPVLAVDECVLHGALQAVYAHACA